MESDKIPERIVIVGTTPIEEEEEEKEITPIPVITNDLDSDGEEEIASSSDNDHYDEFSDPNNSSTLIDIIIEDNNTYYLIDTNEDELPDVIWDLTNNTITTIDQEEPEEEPEDIIIDYNDDGEPDSVYDPDQEESYPVKDVQGEDIDQDGNDEYVIDYDDDPDYDGYYDPDDSSEVVVIVEGDADENTKFIIKDKETNKEFYYDPDTKIFSDIIEEDIDQDTTLEKLFDSNGDGINDRYYDPDDYQIKDLKSSTFTIEAKDLVQKNRTLISILAIIGVVLPLLVIFNLLNDLRSLLPLIKEPFLRLLGILGWRKRNEQGTVYNSKTGQPLALASVNVIDETSGKVREVKVTDKYGQFSFLVSPGEYLLKTFRKGYQEAKDTKIDFYPNKYNFQTLSFNQHSAIASSIPMQGKLGSLQTAYLKSSFLEFLTELIFWAGLTSSFILLFATFSALSIVTTLLYLHLLFIRNVFIQKLKWGKVINKNNKPIPFTALKLYNTQDQLIARTISDEYGRYFLVANKGKYTLQAIESGSGSTKTYSVKLRSRGSVRKRVVL